jgi:hypothetical protein
MSGERGALPIVALGQRETAHDDREQKKTQHCFRNRAS